MRSFAYCVAYLLVLLGYFSHDADAQTVAQAHLERDRVNAGTKYPITIVLPEPFPYNTTMYTFVTRKATPALPAPETYQCNASSVKAGDVSVVFICDNPTDANGGTYTSDIVVHAQPPPGAGRQRNIPVNSVTVEIIGVPETINIPRSAVATLSLPIRDALKSDALKANALLDGFYARIDRDASESVATRQYMATIANAGLEIVEGAEKRNEAADVKEAVSSIIFEDLSRRYREMLTDLSARPLQGQKSEIASPHLLKVQQKRHETITVHDSPTGASIGPLASKLASILLDHVMTFTKIGDTGIDTFPVTIETQPQGASVSVKRIGEEYRDVSQPTDWVQYPLKYARWTLQIKLGDCVEFRKPDPFIDASIKYKITFSCSKK